MLLANFNGKEHLRHRAVSLRQHGFLVLWYLSVIIREDRVFQRPAGRAPACLACIMYPCPEFSLLLGLQQFLKRSYLAMQDFTKVIAPVRCCHTATVDTMELQIQCCCLVRIADDLCRDLCGSIQLLRTSPWPVSQKHHIFHQRRTTNNVSHSITIRNSFLLTHSNQISFVIDQSRLSCSL